MRTGATRVVFGSRRWTVEVPEVSYQTVVVGSDGSATAARAVSEASEIAARHAARLVIVTAYAARGDEAARANAVPDDVRWAVTDINQAEDRVRDGRRVATEAGVARTVTRAVAGSPAEVLLETADGFAADLIVVGSRGLTSGAHPILGSVAAAVAHHAPCDVMIVQTSAAEGR